MVRFGRFAVLAAGAAMIALAGASQAEAAGHCIKAGGSGIGAFEGFASFMARAAMKNSAKGFGGENVKLGKVSEKCTQTGLGWSCKATASACK